MSAIRQRPVRIGPFTIIKGRLWHIIENGRVLGSLSWEGNSFKGYVAWLRWLLSVAQGGLALDMRLAVEWYFLNTMLP